MKLPESAVRVFKGVIFDVYQWPQKMFDGSTETFEMLKRPSTVTVLATHGESIIVHEEEQPGKPPFVTIPGGRREEGEDPLATAKRELLEESGMESDDWEELRVYSPATKIDWEIYVFVARNCRKVADQMLDVGEKIRVREVSWEEFLQIACGERFSETELGAEIMRLRLDPDQSKMDAFRKKIFR